MRLPLDVHLRRLDLDTLAVRPDLLSADESARAERFRFARDARHWAVCRSQLRLTLGAYLGCPPASLRFSVGAWGKPYLPDCRLRFSVSHSENAALIAWAWDREVGVDIERRRADFVPEDLAVSAFSPAEQAWLRGTPPAARQAAFLTLWTAKEAYVKACGSGLSFPLDCLTLTPRLLSEEYAVSDSTPADGRNPITPCREPITVRRLDVGDDYFAALAVESRHDPTDHQHSHQHCCSGI